MYNNHNLYISATGESIYTYVDDTSNNLIEYFNSNSNNIINYIDSNVDVLEYNYKQTVDGNHSNALIVGDRKIEFKSNNIIQTRINDNGFLEVLLKYNPATDDIRYNLIDAKYGSGKWVPIRDIFLDDVLEEVQNDIDNLGKTFFNIADTAIDGSAKIAELQLIGGATAVLGGAVGLTFLASAINDGLDFAQDGANSANNEKLLYNYLFLAIAKVCDETSNNLFITSNLLSERITTTSNALNEYINTTSNTIMIDTSNFVEITSNFLQTQINEKASASHNHTIANIDGLSQEFINSSNYTLNTSNSISNRITGLAVANINGLTTALSEKEPTISLGATEYALVNDTSGKVATLMTVSKAELETLSDINTASTIQTQLNGKQSTLTAGTGISISGNTITNSLPSKWTKSGTNIYYNDGNVGIGGSFGNYKLFVYGDTCIWGKTLISNFYSLPSVSSLVNNAYKRYIFEQKGLTEFISGQLVSTYNKIVYDSILTKYFGVVGEPYNTGRLQLFPFDSTQTPAGLGTNINSRITIGLNICFSPNSPPSNSIVVQKSTQIIQGFYEANAVFRILFINRTNENDNLPYRQYVRMECKINGAWVQNFEFDITAKGISFDQLHFWTFVLTAFFAYCYCDGVMIYPVGEYASETLYDNYIPNFYITEAYIETEQAYSSFDRENQRFRFSDVYYYRDTLLEPPSVKILYDFVSNSSSYSLKVDGTVVADTLDVKKIVRNGANLTINDKSAFMAEQEQGLITIQEKSSMRQSLSIDTVEINTTSNLINNTGFAGYLYYENGLEPTIAKVKSISYSELTAIPTSFPPSSHNHDETYAAISHTHSIANINGLSQEFINSSNYTLNTSNSISNSITGLSTVYAPSSHTHSMSAITGLETEIINVSNYVSSTSNFLQTQINTKQNTLTAGTGISIVNNQISATGGGGSSVWTDNSSYISYNNVRVYPSEIRIINNLASTIASWVYYKFESAVNLLTDSSGNNRSLTNNGGTYASDTKNSILLAPTKDATIPSADWSTVSDLTVSGWFKTSSFASGNKIFEILYVPPPPATALLPATGMTGYTTTISGYTYRACALNYDNVNNFPVWQLYDRNTTTRYASLQVYTSGIIGASGVSFGADTTFKGSYVGIDMGQSFVLQYYRITQASALATRRPRTWKVYATNDDGCWNATGGTNSTPCFNTSSTYGWVQIHSVSENTTYTDATQFVITGNTTPYRYYALSAYRVIGTDARLDFTEWYHYGYYPYSAKSIKIHRNVNDLTFQIDNTVVHETAYNLENTWTHIIWNIEGTNPFVRINNGTKYTFASPTLPSTTYTNKLGSTTNAGSLYVSDFRILTTPMTTAIENSLYDPTSYTTLVDDAYVNNAISGITTGSTDWASITNKPNTFASDWSTTANKPTSFASDWNTTANKPSTFATTANDFTGILPVSKGGTGLGILTANQLLIGNGTGNILQSANLLWDNTNNRLRIGSTTAPAYNLDVAGSINATSYLLNGSAFTGSSQWTTSGANIYYTAGSVGIGTSSAPANKLEIYGGGITVTQPAATYSSYMGFRNTGGNNIGYIGIDGIGYKELEYGAFLITTWTTNPLIFGTNTNERMRIATDGNITMKNNLTVDGSISEGGTNLSSKYAALSHPHAITDVSGLPAALEAKSSTGHTHDGRYVRTFLNQHFEFFVFGNTSITYRLDLVSMGAISEVVSGVSTTYIFELYIWETSADFGLSTLIRAKYTIYLSNYAGNKFIRYVNFENGITSVSFSSGRHVDITVPYARTIKTVLTSVLG